MTDKGKPVEAASAAPGEKRSVSRPQMAKASESGDPAVHKALGDLETARRNLAAARGVKDPDAEQSAADAQARLAELGYE